MVDTIVQVVQPEKKEEFGVVWNSFSVHLFFFVTALARMLVIVASCAVKCGNLKGGN